MRRLAAWIAILCALTARPATAAAPADQPHIVVQDPDWISRPAADDLAGLYPPAAAALGLEGHVVVRCRVAVSGFVEACQVVEETPGNAGFGAAALQATGFFKMRPRMVGGKISGGAQVDIPLSWRLPPRPANGPVTIADKLAERFPMEWAALIARMKARPEITPATLSQEVGDLMRGLWLAHGRDSANAPPAQARVAIDGKTRLLSALRDQSPTLCARFALGLPLTTEPTPTEALSEAGAAVTFASLDAMAAGMASPSPHGALTLADRRLIRERIEDQDAAIAVWDANGKGEIGLLSSEQVCDGFIALNQAFAGLPDEVVGRFWRNSLGPIPTPAAAQPALKDGPAG